MAKHVAVLMGGWSAEREVSLRSGKACADALSRRGYRVTPIDVGRDIAAVLGAAKPDVALNVLHGRPGEDGTLQGLLEILGIPYSHSGVLASALAMQKDYAKAMFRAVGVPVAEDRVVSRFEAAKAPCHGAALCDQADRRRLQRRRFHRHRGRTASAAGTVSRRLDIRRHGDGRALHRRQGTHLRGHGDRALDVIEIVPTTRFYDYEAKYAAGGSKHLLPAPILPNVYQEVRNSDWLPIAHLAAAA